MEVYLIRHGIAADREAYTNDGERPLTDKGYQKTEKVARRLWEIGLRFDLILTSPLIRACQTAEILQNVGLSEKIEEFAPLAPDGDIQAWVSWWFQWRYNSHRSCLALVGHQPNLGNWAETLVWGNAPGKLVVKKAGVIGVKLPETGTPVGNSELFLLTSPKWLL